MIDGVLTLGQAQWDFNKMTYGSNMHDTTNKLKYENDVLYYKDSGNHWCIIGRTQVIDAYRDYIAEAILLGD